MIRVGVVDDHSGVRAAIISLLRGAGDILVVGEGATGAGAIALARNLKPDLMLLDVELPDIRGDAVMILIHEKQPEMKVLPVSTYSDREHVSAMVDHGADGYITKDEAPSMLLEAIRSIITGRKWLSPRASRSARKLATTEPDLTPKETTILDHLLSGESEAEIAASLNFDQRGLARHLQFLMEKFDVGSLDELKSLARARRASRKSQGASSPRTSDPRPD